MKKTILCLLVFITSFAKAEGIADIPAQLKDEYSHNYQEWLASIDGLEATLKADKFNWDIASKQFFEMRLAYKRIEVFVAYFEDHFISDFINGAPLPKPNRKKHELEIIQPSGIQITEEALIERDSTAFREHVLFLKENAKQVSILMANARYYQQKIFEAMREELIRIAALGITGYDSPGTETVLKENKEALSTVHGIISHYYPHIGQEHTMAFENDIIKGYTYFSQTDFETFDRFGFIQECINPLYERLLTVQQELEIPTKTLVLTTQYSVNYDATNIFQTDFLNYKYYTKYGVLDKSEERAELGKLLFFDPIFSSNNQRACASCHQAELAFTDGAQKSLAFDQESTTDRNAPTLTNAIYTNRFFHDMRSMSMEDQFDQVITNPVELNTTYEDIIVKIKSCPDYVAQFAKLFPTVDEPINKYSIAACITEYIASLTDYGSNFDKHIRGTQEVEDGQLIKDGFNIFTGKGKCATCHFIPTFGGTVPPHYDEQESEVLAVPNINNEEKAVIDPDKGRIENKLPRENAYFYEFAFKTPTIRNIEKTGPYMHNGVYKTLEEVVDFYDMGGGHAWGIAPEHTTLPADSLHLTDDEKSSLIIFMKSLTYLSPQMLDVPTKLPESTSEELKGRKVGGQY